jgi:hypothetical protein
MRRGFHDSREAEEQLRIVQALAPEGLAGYTPRNHEGTFSTAVRASAQSSGA